MTNHWLCVNCVPTRPWKMCGMSLGGVTMIPIKRYGRGGMSDYGTVQGTDASAVGSDSLRNDVRAWRSDDEDRRGSGGVARGDRENPDSVDGGGVGSRGRAVGV